MHLSVYLLESTRPFLTSNQQENHFGDKKSWDGEQGGKEMKAGKKSE